MPVRMSHINGRYRVLGGGPPQSQLDHLPRRSRKLDFDSALGEGETAKVVWGAPAETDSARRVQWTDRAAMPSPLGVSVCAHSVTPTSPAIVRVSVNVMSALMRMSAPSERLASSSSNVVTVTV